MAAYRRVYDTRHLQLTAKTGISSGTLRLAIEYGLPLPFYSVKKGVGSIKTSKMA